MKRFLGCLLAALLALSLCACAESAQAGKATVTVDQSALYARVGEEVTLPAATAADADGKDCSASVSVTVTFGGSTVFSGKGNAENTFTPTQEGAYTANYFVAEGESVLSDTYTVNIQVNDNTPVEPARSAPVIRVDTSYASFYEDEGGSTRAAEGYDEVDKDLTDSVRVSVTDYEGEAVFSGVGGAEHALTGLAVGTYTVSYSLENSAGLSAEEKSYRLTVVSSANIAPELHAPTKDYSLFVGETLAIAPATAEDYEDGERAVSYELRAAGGSVLSSGTADRVHRYTFTEAGSYTVEYTAEDTEGVQVSADYAVTVTAVTESGIVMDGIVNEKEYFAIPSYTLGVSGNTTYRFIAADEGLYIGAVVSDRNLLYSDLAAADAKLNNSDGLEFAFDPKDTDASYLNWDQSACDALFRVRIGVDGTVAYYEPAWCSGGATTSDQWMLVQDELNEGFLSAVHTEGTLAVKGSDDTTAEDTGYSAELFLPWEMFGWTSRPDLDGSYGKEYIRIGLGQRDVTHATLYNTYNAQNSDPNSRNNICFNGMNVSGRPKVASEGLHPGLYSRLYVAGDLLGVNPVSREGDEVVLDGCMSEGFWADATQIPMPDTSQGAVAETRLKTTQNGIYIGVWANDGNLTASDAAAAVNNYGIAGNDMIDVRVISGEEMDLTALVPYAGNEQTDGKILLFDPAGSMLMGMVHQMGINRTLRQLPIEYGIYTDGTVAYSAGRDGWLSDNRFIADTNDRDADGGWGVEVFLPWETVGLQAPSAANPEVKFKVLAAVYDRNPADVTGAAWVYSYRSLTSVAKSDPTNPSSYFAATAVYEGGQNG